MDPIPQKKLRRPRRICALASAALVSLTTLPDGAANPVDFEVAPSPTDNFKTAQFRMWVPDNPARLRGTLVVQTGFNHDGRNSAGDTSWQAVANRHGLAVMAGYWVAVFGPGGTKKEPHRHYGHVAGGSGAAFWKALEAMADQAGHPELKTRPIALWGHSAGGQFSHSMACTYPERVAVFVGIKGGYYHTEPAPGAIAGVPGLMIAGGKDEPFRFDAIRRVFETGRALGAPWARAVEPEAGHGVEQSDALAIPYLETLIRLRIGENGALKPLDLAAGWTGDLATKKIAPAEGLPQNSAATAWFPDKTTAELWQKFCGDYPMNQTPATKGEDHVK